MPTGSVLEHPASGHEKKKEVPTSWFAGTGYKYTGIDKIHFSTEFINKFGIKIPKIMMDYGDRVHSKNKDEETKMILIEDNDIVKRETGFTIQELMAKKRSLEKELMGKKKVPFEFGFELH